MTRPAAFDAMVIGAGLFGAFSALFLARAGLKVVLLERGFVGAQSSGANFGGLRLQGRDPAQYPLALRAQTHWEGFVELVGEDCEYDRAGHVYFARTREGRAKLLKYAATSEASGLTVEILEGNALRARLPLLAPEIAIASYSQRCATANPRLATPAVCRAFLRTGGVLHEGFSVAGVGHEHGLFTAVSADGRVHSAPILVNAAGGWAGALAATFGERVPIFAAGPPQFVTEPLPYILRPTIQAVEGDVIVRQIPRGNVIFAGYPRTRSTCDGKHTFVPPQKTRMGMAALVSALPAFRHAEVIRSWSGVEGYLPDMLPVVGPSATTEGLFHAFGGSGGGFQIAPAVGECLAATIVGEPPPTSLHPYRIGRFDGHLEESEKLLTEFDRADERGAGEGILAG
ncbi:NAD(P)/FAD-dependent oxidoreductase [Afifella marina]|uniref:Sarcosine oxidase subunit beta n=1 Tax=Afifella marina DSM 2698 TaxID=1120955 RepID=A0A1G5MD95_AFIMA|nr:FAD-binding oxidoreductase [Afifella marina]MBK1622599.1 FAD-binding oxidoreductase [Afifella marina DSM 2698]MBK1625594.1 FAD-binding oxidoreductase [Afifella marina]MBK5917417.1 FAD-dependent oxidoreductase [Afifella marina]RAI23367.1 FAD-dependent oxidoreductase [Afifella marina DSM 2698]SCZ23147.1 sarcosine oxidase subunit beta [Afifella marina DSM 2698]